MGMIGCLRLLPDSDLGRLLADPSLLPDYLDGEEVDGFGPFADLDVDKAWHGIHFLLTNSAEGGSFPLAFLIVGGRNIGDEDMGYGPARGFAAREVAQIAAALSKVDPIGFCRSLRRQEACKTRTSTLASG